MTAPAYHLRPNKAADRLALMEAIGRLARLGSEGLEKYTYHGFGGPYLEEFRLLYERYPEISMVSIEEDPETFNRQKFHRTCSSLKLINEDLSSYIDSHNVGETKSIFWLDYTGLEYDYFTDFQNLLRAVAYDSMIKVTLRAEPSDFLASKEVLTERGKEFSTEFGSLLPSTSTSPPWRPKDFASLLQTMIRISAQQILHTENEDVKFVPVSSFHYSDGSWMFTITGIVCRNSEVDRLCSAFADWEFANLTWEPPQRINVPVLSTKERLRLQPLLPDETPGKTLHKELGYTIDGDCTKTEKALEQYAAFHRYSPYFLRGMP